MITSEELNLDLSFWGFRITNLFISYKHPLYFHAKILLQSCEWCDHVSHWIDYAWNT